MYIPRHYKSENRESAIAFMKRFNFGTIVTAKSDKPVATHLPFVISEKEDRVILSSHFAKANTQWNEIEHVEVLVIFTEPHAYISPSNYNKKQHVPTWNYLSVHAYGSVKIISEEAAVFNLLENMMENFEPEYKAQWNELPMEYKTRMANGIVAFEMEVSELQSKEKLSQNKKEEERHRVIDALSKSEQGTDRLVAEYMAKKEQE